MALTKGAQDLLEAVLFHRLDEVAVTNSMVGTSEKVTRRELEHAAHVWIAENAGPLGVLPGSPELDEAEETAAEMVDELMRAYF